MLTFLFTLFTNSWVLTLAKKGIFSAKWAYCDLFSGVIFFEGFSPSRSHFKKSGTTLRREGDGLSFFFSIWKKPRWRKNYRSRGQILTRKKRFFRQIKVFQKLSLTRTLARTFAAKTAHKMAPLDVKFTKKIPSASLNVGLEKNSSEKCTFPGAAVDRNKQARATTIFRRKSSSFCSIFKRTFWYESVFL